jgi:integrase
MGKPQKDDENTWPKNLYKRGDSWVIDFYFRGLRYTETLGQMSKTAAQEKRDKRRGDISAGELAVNGKLWRGKRWVSEVQESPIIEDPPFENAMNKFLEWYKTENADYTYRKYAKPSSKSLEEFFKGYQLSQISLVLIEKYKRHRKQAGKADATVNHELRLLRHFFNKCIDFKLAESNPFRIVTKTTEGDYRVERVRLLKEKERTRYLSTEEAARLLATCKRDLKIVVLAALHTGFRSSELKSLCWSNIDLANGFGTVDSRYSKNGETRTVPLTPDLLQALKALKQERKNAKSTDRVFLHKGKPWKCWKEAFDGPSIVPESGISIFMICAIATAPGWP